jgi:hypothetical protein
MNERIKFESKGTNLDQIRQRRLGKLAQDTFQMAQVAFSCCWAEAVKACPGRVSNQTKQFFKLA